MQEASGLTIEVPDYVSTWFEPGKLAKGYEGYGSDEPLVSLLSKTRDFGSVLSMKPEQPRTSFLTSLFILLTSALSVSCVTESGGAQPYGGQPYIGQTIGGFHRPESVAFSLDGRTLFVGNCASDLFGPDRKLVGMVRGKGAVSKLTVGKNGHVSITDRRFIEGLNSPLGLGILPVATDRLPVGTLLVNQGITLLVDSDGNPVTDAAQLETGVMFFDPETGEELGKIDLGVGSVVANRIGHATLLPNSIAFDSEGNLYVTDTAKGGDRQIPAQVAHPGLIRIEHGAIDRLIGGVDAGLSSTDVTFTPMAGVPNGVGYWPAEDAICVVTMGGDSPEGTAIYKIPADTFPRADLPAPLRGDTGTADGVAFTPAGTILTSRFSGDLLAVPKHGEPFPLNIEALVAPADHRLLTLADGSSILAVPEQARVEPTHWDQRVRIVRLPKGF